MKMISRKYRSKIFRWKKHNTTIDSYCDLDAYVNPSLELQLDFVADGRCYEIIFNKKETARLLKRITLDCSDRIEDIFC